MTDYERWADLSDREATGEPLSEADRDFLLRFADENDLARAEAALWDRLAALDSPADDGQTRLLADRAVAAVSKKGSRSSRTWGWLAGGAVAAAAAAALFVAGRGTGGDRRSALLELSAGEVRADGSVVKMGARIEENTRVTIAGGPACLM